MHDADRCARAHYVGTATHAYFGPEVSGRYYISVGSGTWGHDFERRTGTYTLKVERLPDDYPADTTTTGSVVVGGKATGNVQFPYDPDWFAVELEADTPYLVQGAGVAHG